VIARLHGRIAAIEPDAVVVDVGGVGYRVHLPGSVLRELGAEGAVVTLHTHLHVRETDFTLYGAADADTLALFRQLLTVSGVGPRLALAMLSSYDAETLRRAIVAEDTAALSEVPGVGRKTAQRIVLDLKTKLQATGVLAGAAAGWGAGVTAADDEALAALTSLGYSAGEARRALAVADADAVAGGAEPGVEERIVAALRLLAG
jgi:Holliday junction DNA helicase RuvA